ncbi:MAG: hypothetical protein PUP91_15715 [Rhizonema sp. PD37]|nr:hypothetical protein [Rhizonema sp. PD37]
MLENPNIGITGTRAENFLEPNTQVPPWFNYDQHLQECNVIIPSTLVVRRSVFHQIGNFSQKYQSEEDTEWLRRAEDNNVNTFMIPEILTLRRLHGTNLSWKMKPMHKFNMLRIIKESIARQRRAS